MNWIIAAFLMFFSSVVMYLLVRYATRIHISAAMQNVSMFIIPTLVYIVLANMQHIRLSLTVYEWVIMIVTAIGFSYFGSKFSMDSIVEAPNPGYSLIISKSYVVMTAIASIFLFQQSLNLKSAIAILLIVGFSSLIMIDPHVHQKKVKIKPIMVATRARRLFLLGDACPRIKISFYVRSSRSLAVSMG